MTITQTWTFDDENDYVFNSDEIEVTGGVAKLKDKTDPEETFLAWYPSGSIDAYRSDGVGTGTAYGGATTDAEGFLDLAHNDIRYVDYSATGNADSTQVGCARFKVRPAYSGTPSSHQIFFALTNSDSANKANQIILLHTDAGYLRFIALDNASVTQIDTLLGAWSPVAGTDYEIEINWDFTTGDTMVFVDGERFGPTLTQTFTRNASELIRIGNNINATFTSNFKVKYVQIFNNVKHYTNYTPSEPSLETYSTSNPTITLSASFYTDGIISGAQTATIPTGTEIKRVLVVDGVDWWWNTTTGEWEQSDGTYSQANTAAEMGPHLSEIDLSNGVAAKFKLFLHSDDGTATPEVDEISITYDYHGPNADHPELCTVYGYVVDAEGNYLSGIEIIVVSDNSAKIDGKTQYLPKKDVITYSDTNGYWEIDLIKSSEFSPPTDYTFKFYCDGILLSKSSGVTVPDADYINFNSLI